MPQAPETQDPAGVGMTGRLGAMIQRNYAGRRGLTRLLITNFDYLLGTAVKFTNPDLSKVDRLVFVCMANLKRSAFAHAVSRRAGLNTASFGLNTISGQPPLPLAIRVASEMGYEFDDHRSTDLLNFRPKRGDLYLVMELRHAYELTRQGFPPHQVALLGYWSCPQRLHIHDPHRMGLEYLRTCYTLIQSAVINLGRELHALGRATRPESQPPAKTSRT